MIKKAVIPVAGIGTRMFPITLAVKKEFLPVLDENMLPKPAIQIIIEEAINAGIEEICLIIQPDDLQIFKNYFNVKLRKKLEQKLRKNGIYDKQIDWIRSIGERLHFVYQKKQKGFGHAIFQAASFVKNDPFLLLLGDQIYFSKSEKSCTKQIIDMFNEIKNPDGVIALTRIHEEFIHLYGCVSVKKSGIRSNLRKSELLKIQYFIEKPDLAAAKKLLQCSFLPERYYYCVLGQYILAPEIFEHLKYEIKNDIKFKGEFQLTTAMDRFCRESQKFYGFETKGEYLDIGRPQSYLRAVSAFVKSNI